MRVNWLNFALFLVAVALLALLIVPGVLATATMSLVRWKSNGGPVAYLSRTAGVLALSIDILGNVLLKDLLEVLMLGKPDPYPFGRVGETISYVLGRNKIQGTLSKTGLLLADILNWLDPRHVENAVLSFESKHYANVS